MKKKSFVGWVDQPFSWLEVSGVYAKRIDFDKRNTRFVDNNNKTIETKVRITIEEIT